MSDFFLPTNYNSGSSYFSTPNYNPYQSAFGGGFDLYSPTSFAQQPFSFGGSLSSYQQPDVFGGYPGSYGSNYGMPGAMNWQPALDASFIAPQYRTASMFNALQNAAAGVNFSGGGDGGGWVNGQYYPGGGGGISPTALSMMIYGETEGWNPNATSPGGRYAGMTQMGRDTFNEQPGGRLGGLTYDQYLNASPEQQIGVYPSWLNYYNAPFKTSGLNIGAMEPWQQAAYLQALQFAPSGGNYLYDPNAYVTTQHPQAAEMRVGSPYPTMNTLNSYERNLYNNPPWSPQTPWAGVY